MDDRELLEKAAKAYGWAKWLHGDAGFFVSETANRSATFANWKPWNPLTDDGDALRLAVRLGITISPGEDRCAAQWWRRPGMIEQDDVVEWTNGDPYAATRRCIVRAAAAMAKED